jgi:hypothetical protein
MPTCRRLLLPRQQQPAAMRQTASGGGGDRRRCASQLAPLQLPLLPLLPFQLPLLPPLLLPLVQHCRRQEPVGLQCGHVRLLLLLLRLPAQAG